MTDRPGEWNLPYEPVGGEPIVGGAFGDMARAGAVTFLAGVLPLDVVKLPGFEPGEQLPLLIFDFGVDPFTRRQIPRVALIMDRDGLRRLPQLVADTVEGAIKAAKP